MKEERKKCIEIIEDYEPLRMMLEEKLKNNNFDVIPAKNGQEGLSFALSKHPNLILLDLLMPGLDGMTVLERLRKDPWGKDVPILILTNLSETDQMVKAARNKAYGYLVKTDWKLDDVISKIKEKIGE